MKQNAAAETLHEVPSMEPEQTKDIAVGVALAVSLGEGKQITFQTYYAQGVTIEEQNRLLDRLVSAGDRLKAKADIRAFEADLEKREATQKALAEDLIRLRSQNEARWSASGRKGDYKPSQQEQAAEQNAETQLKRHRDGIESLKKAIEEARKLAV